MSTNTIARVEKIVGPLTTKPKPNGCASLVPAITGIRPYPDDMTDQKILEEFAYPSANGARLKKLLAGDISDYPSASEADLACASDLAFWFWLDPAAIENVMRDSDLARDKWDDHKDYLTVRTIGKALAGKIDYFGKQEDRPSMETLPSTKKANGHNASPDPKAFNYREHMRPVQDLIDHPPAPIEYIVEDMIARGSSSLLIGKPKSYKTSIMLQIATALSGNPNLLDGWAHFKKLAKGGRAVFIDLEQHNRIFFDQLMRMGTTKVAANFERLTQFPKLDEDGIAVLRDMIEKEKFSFVIIDSLARVKPDPKRGGSVFADDAQVMQRITNLAHELNVHIMVIAHAGKRDAGDDPMEMIAGTNGLTASVDDVFVWFTPKDGDIGSTKRRNLFMSGRNIRRPGTFVFEKKDTDSLFVLQGSEDQFVKGEMKRRIFAILGGGAAMTPSQLANDIGGARSNIHRALEALVAEKRVQRLEGGKYSTKTGAAKRQLEVTEDTDE